MRNVFPTILNTKVSGWVRFVAHSKSWWHHLFPYKYILHIFKLLGTLAKWFSWILQEPHATHFKTVLGPGNNHEYFESDGVFRVKLIFGKRSKVISMTRVTEALSCQSSFYEKHLRMNFQNYQVIQIGKWSSFKWPHGLFRELFELIGYIFASFWPVSQL